jgi:hypothetical protein
MELLRWLRLQWDRVLGVAAIVTGAVALLVGWSKVSATAYPAEQIPYVVSAGLGGLFLLGLGATLWQSAAMSDEWRKLDRLEERLDAAAAVEDTNMVVLPDHPEPGPDSRRFTGTPASAGRGRR